MLYVCVYTHAVALGSESEMVKKKNTKLRFKVASSCVLRSYFEATFASWLRQFLCKATCSDVVSGRSHKAPCVKPDSPSTLRTHTDSPQVKIAHGTTSSPTAITTTNNTQHHRRRRRRRRRHDLRRLDTGVNKKYRPKKIRQDQTNVPVNRIL